MGWGVGGGGRDRGESKGQGRYDICQLLKMVRDISSSNERIKRRVNNVIEEFFVIYAKIGPEPVTIQVQ